MKRKAVFLDRDGVINVDTDYVHLPEQVEFVDGIFDFCRAAHAKGYALIVITNQSGIDRGLYSEEQFHILMHWMEAKFEEEGCPLTAYYFCPHLPDAGCGCRKPQPGMIMEAATKWGIDLAQSLLVGDRATDMGAGKAAGVSRVELFSGKFPAL